MGTIFVKVWMCSTHSVLKCAVCDKPGVVSGLSLFYQAALALAAQIILHLVVIPGKIKGKHAFLSIKYQPPC